MTQTSRLLVIEDDPAIALSLQDALKRDGYAVTWKNNGAEGIAFAREQNPQLIILDVRLPDGSGLDFCKQMRALGIRQPILMLTVQRDEIDKVVGLEMGADDYLTKPYSLRELLARVRALLRRAYGELASTESNVLFVRDLTIDLARGLVKRGEQTLALTPTEFRLLVYLAQNAGQALTREQILQAVWGYAEDVEDDRAVNVHIRRLREKIEIEPSRPSLILTVPGIGYRLSRQ